MWSVYLLKSSKKRWYYVGSTNAMTRRLSEHNSGKVSATKAHYPLKLAYKEEYFTEKEARMRERKIKDQRLLKEQIIRSIEK